MYNLLNSLLLSKHTAVKKRIKMAKSVLHDLLQIFKSSVAAVLPENLIRRSVKYNNVAQQLTISDHNYDVCDKNIYLIGTGKAVQNMAVEVERILGPKIKQGIISIPVGSLKFKSSQNLIYYEGAENNLPDTAAEATSRKIKELIKQLGIKDILLVLISGGGSALLPLPKDPITLEEKTLITKWLANAGADIKELNSVRKRISDIKGGELAIQAQPAQVISLILSDIVGDPLDLIASGPTTENKDDPSMAIDIIKKYNLFNNLPATLKIVLSKSSEVKFPTENVKNYLIGSNKLSLSAASKEATKLNYLALELSNTVTGNVKDIAKAYAALAKYICKYLQGRSDNYNLKSEIDGVGIPGIDTNFIKRLNRNKDICLILGGEITVAVNGTGKGGRNQQLALEFSYLLHHIKNEVKYFDIYLLSAGTDGIDGPTDAAGGIGYTDLILDSKNQNLDVQKYLDNNDSYNFYNVFRNGALHVITGHTNTNVMDMHIMIIVNKTKR